MSNDQTLQKLPPLTPAGECVRAGGVGRGVGGGHKPPKNILCAGGGVGCVCLKMVTPPRTSAGPAQDALRTPQDRISDFLRFSFQTEKISVTPIMFEGFFPGILKIFSVFSRCLMPLPNERPPVRAVISTAILFKKLVPAFNVGCTVDNRRNQKEAH